MEAKSLRPFFEPLVALYSDLEDFMPLDGLKESAGEHPTLADKLTDDWGVFDDPEVTRQFLDACCEPYDPRDNPGPDPFDPDRCVDEEELFWEGDYELTQRLSACWGELKVELSTQNRFFAGSSVIEELEQVFDDAVGTVAKSTPLYRVRRSINGVSFSKKEMGAPPSALASAGRANPVGIPYLYLASSRETAVSEVRPHVGDQVCVGTFKLRASQRIVDLRDPYIGSPFRWGERLATVLRAIRFLRELGEELSRPVGPENRDREYLPTQYLCELFKRKSYDGVAYRSGLGDGFNLALFDTKAAYCTSVDTVHVEKVSIELAPIDRE